MSTQREAAQERPTDLRAENIVQVARFLARLLDSAIVLPGGIRIGLDPLIGLIPGLGDALASLTGSVILLLAAHLGVPKIVLIRMGLNTLINGMVGTLPGIGDLFSFWFKSNLRNAELLERYSQPTARPSTLADWAFVLGLLLGVVAALVALLLAVLWVIARIWAAVQ